MTLYIDQKYANLLSPKLQLFKWNDSKSASFRCPICGDSEKNKLKKRGYIYTHKDSLFMKCHNCQTSLTFDKFLKLQDEHLHKEYLYEKFKYNNDYRWSEKRNNDRVEQLKLKVEEPQVTSNALEVLTSVADLSDDHPCKQYVINRKIPIEFWTKLFYTDNYRKWINDYVVKEKFKTLSKFDERLVIPFYKRNGVPFAYQGRYIGADERVTRYITIHEKEDSILIYGLDRVDLKKPIYVVEGPIDSMFLNNCIAVAGSGLKKLLTYNDIDPTYIFDNQPREPTVVKLLERIIKLNKKVVIFPETVLEKDINDMIKSGLTSEQIHVMLNDNTFSGLHAQIKFNQWKKV